MAPPRILLGALAASSLTMLASAASAGTITYSDSSCAAYNVSGSGTGTITIQCQTAPPPTAPNAPSCGIVATPTAVPPTGGSVQLTAACNTSSYPAPTQYVWSGPGIPTGTATTTTPSGPPSFTGMPGQTYSLTPSTAGVNGTTTSVLLTDSTNTTFAGTCSGFTKTIYKKFNLATYAGNLLVDTYSEPSGPMVKGAIVVMEITTPPSGGGPDKDVLFAVVEYPGNAPMVGRSMFVSKKPCDLTATAGQWTMASSGEMSLWMTFGGPSSRGYAILQPNTTYYVMVVNRSGRVPTETCTSWSSCDLRLEFPRGTM